MSGIREKNRRASRTRVGKLCISRKDKACSWNKRKGLTLKWRGPGKPASYFSNSLVWMAGKNRYIRRKKTSVSLFSRKETSSLVKVCF